MRMLCGIILAAVAVVGMAETAVNVDVGRQLFVDDELVSTTTLKRVWHHPKKYEGNPVMSPETPWEVYAPNNATVRPNGGGMWWDPKEQVFKLWYEGGWLHTVCYATSRDGIHFERPKLDVVDGTNIVLPTNNPAYRPDSWSVVKDPNPRRADELYKLLLHRPWCGDNSAPEGLCAVSGDGIHWKPLYPLPSSGDRSSLYFDPFEDEWVYSIRSSWRNDGETHGRRNRCIFTQRDFTRIPEWYWRNNSYGLRRWLEADVRDEIDPAVADPARFPRTQLYNFDAVAYESLMLGLFEIHLGPENGECENAGLPKITDVKFGFSRGGHDFRRYDFSPAIASERWGSDRWDVGYVQPLANGCVIVGDELYFYYGAFRGEPKRANTNDRKYAWQVDNGMYANGAMGLAKLRRDGFASMEGTGELLTKPLHFSGEYLFVNADAHDGSVSAELVDKEGNVVEGFSAADSRLASFDSTKRRIVWKNRDRLDVRKFSGHRLRFKVENAALYAFWISLSPEGESNGYLAGGGPSYDGLRDTPRTPRPVVAPAVCTPQATHARAGRRHEGIPSIAVSANGTMWATWYAGPTPYEDEYNYLVLSKSTDGGLKWRETLVCDPDGNGPRRAFDPELWIAPDGLLRWTWTDKVGPCPAVADNDQLWMATLDPETGVLLEEPRVVAKGVMMNKPTVLKDGTWILPVAHWWANPSACCYASTDGGRTFELRGGVSLPKKQRGYDEHTILERRDGSLVCYMRTFNGNENCLFESESRDGGRTWGDARPSPVGNCSSRTFVTKLRDGRWLMVKHDGYSKVVGRERLTALLSEDDGRTWWGGLLLDQRRGCSYPDGQQLADGSVVVVSDFDRTGAREISFVRFRPEDVIAAGPRPERRIITVSMKGL